MRTGLGVFPISTRNSPEAIAHLLKATGTNLLFVEKNPALENLVVQTEDLLSASGSSIKLQVWHMPVFEDLYVRDSGNDAVEWYPSVEYDLNAVGLMLHSSGPFRFSPKIS